MYAAALHTQLLNGRASMKSNDAMQPNRRLVLQSAGASLVLWALPLEARAADARKGLKIGVIGSGRVGGTIGALWVKAGHEVMFSSLDVEHDRKLAAGIGAGARAGTPKEAAAFGDVLFFAVPYAALPGLGRDLAVEIKGKIVLDASNPVPGRDGDMAKEALAKGTGVASPQFLPGVTGGHIPEQVRGPCSAPRRAPSPVSRHPPPGRALRPSPKQLKVNVCAVDALSGVRRRRRLHASQERSQAACC